jgi:hypothetical protein
MELEQHIQEFDATPEMVTCKWCQYSDICEEAM